MLPPEELELLPDVLPPEDELLEEDDEVPELLLEELLDELLPEELLPDELLLLEELELLTSPEASYTSNSAIWGAALAASIIRLTLYSEISPKPVMTRSLPRVEPDASTAPVS